MTEHKSIVNCEDKFVNYLDELGNLVEIHEIQRPLELRKISIMQLKKAQRKGSSIYVAHISDLDIMKLILDDYPILKEFHYVFKKI